MTQENSETLASEPLLAAWIKWTMDFWDTMALMGPGPAGRNRGEGQAPAEAEAPGEPWQASLNLWQAFFSLLTEPGTVAAVFQGIRAPSKVILRMAQAGWAGYFCLHRQWLEAWQGEGFPCREDCYENLDQDIFKACNEIFEDDFRRLLNLPPLGLTGLAQEKVNRAREKFNQFQSAMADFIYLLYLPVKKSLRAMRGGGAGGQENLPEEFKDYYKGWLKVMEGHYMTLFQSPEYIQTLTRTLAALEEFTTAKQELLSGAMSAMGLPTRRELDELYREIYRLKKEMKMVTRQRGRRTPNREEG